MGFSLRCRSTVLMLFVMYTQSKEFCHDNASPYVPTPVRLISGMICSLENAFLGSLDAVSLDEASLTNVSLDDSIQAVDIVTTDTRRNFGRSGWGRIIRKSSSNKGLLVQGVYLSRDVWSQKKRMERYIRIRDRTVTPPENLTRAKHHADGRIKLQSQTYLSVPIIKMLYTGMCWDGMLGHQFNKRFKSFASCYS